jgi:hypothetical protein
MAGADMGNVAELFSSSYDGVEATVAMLKEIATSRGTDAAVSVATEMIVAASTAIAREVGPSYARSVLAVAGTVLPQSRPG